MQTTNNDDEESYASFLNQQNAAQDDFQSEGLITNNEIDFSSHNKVTEGESFVKRSIKQGKYEQNLDKKYKEFKELENKLSLLKKEETAAFMAFHNDINNKKLREKYEDKSREVWEVELEMKNINRYIENGENQKQERLLIDKFNSLNHAFVSGLLRTVGEPFLYQWLDKNDKNKISKKKNAFGDVDYQELIQDTKLNNDEKSILSIYYFFGNLWNDYYWSKCKKDDCLTGKQQLEEASEMILKRKDVLAKLYLKYILFGFTDRHYANVLIDKKKGKTDVLEIDFDPHFEFGFKETDKYFLFDKQGRYGRETNITHMNEFFNDLQNKYPEEFKEIVKAITDQAGQYTMNNGTKFKDLIKNIAKFGHHLDIDKEVLEEFITANLDRFKEYIEFRIEEIKKNKPTNEAIKDALITSLEATKASITALDKKSVISECVGEYYQLTKTIDEIRNNISWLINQHLGKPKDKQKKLYWNKQGDGCKNGKLLNERCFLKGKSGYIKKINRKWDELLDNDKINYKTKLDDLKSFVEQLNEKEANSCCPF